MGREFAKYILNIIYLSDSKLSHKYERKFCSTIPIILQWEGHSVSIVGIECFQKEYNLLVLDPQIGGSVLKRELWSFYRDNEVKYNYEQPPTCLQVMRLCVKDLVFFHDIQLLLCKGRIIDEEKLNVLVNNVNYHVVIAGT